MKERISSFARWWIAGAVIALVSVGLLESELFLGDLQAPCDLNVLLGFYYYALILTFASVLLFLLANHDGNKMFWGICCLLLCGAMISWLLATGAAIFLILTAGFAFGMMFVFPPFRLAEERL